MLEDVGLNHTMEACKHYNEAWGRAMVDLVKERFGQQGSDLEAIAMTGYYGYCCTSAGHIEPLEIREGGAVCELYACPNPGLKAPPEMCIAMSHIFANSICKTINPDYECIYTHHMGNNDDCCRWVVMKKASKFTLDDLGKLEKDIPLELSMDEMMSFTARMVVFKQLFTFTSAFNDLVGSQRAVERVAPLARETGLRLGAKLRSAAGEKGDLSMVNDKLDLLGTTLQQRGPPALITESSIEREVTDCPCKGAAPEVCKQLEGVFNGICEAINPDYEFAYDRMMSKGDSTCHWTVRKKTADMEAAPQEPVDDPLKVLRLRFAKGEITKEEYLEMKALLE